MRIDQDVLIAVPAERVFELIAELERAPEWQPSVEKVDVEGGGEVGLGTRGRELRRFAGRSSEGQFEVVEFEPGRRIAIRSRARGVDGTARFDVAPADGDTRVSLALDLEIGGALRFLAGAARGRIERETRESLERLKRLAESEVAS